MKIRLLQVMMIIAISISAICLAIGIPAIGTGSDNIVARIPGTVYLFD